MGRSKLACVLGVILNFSAPLARAASEKAPPLRLEEGVYTQVCGAEDQEVVNPALPVDVPCVESWLKLRDLTGTHILYFLYYDPQGNLYATTTEDWRLQPTSKKSYHKAATVRHRLPIAGEQASLEVGDWKIAVVLDDIAVAEGAFRLERKAIPDNADINEGRKLYLDLSYEQAAAHLQQVLPTLTDRGQRAEALWWLALSQLSMGRRADAGKSVEELLKADPAYAISPEAAKEAGGEQLVSVLEEERTALHPELYKKTAAPPEVELSKAEKAPEVRKSRPLWKKIFLYVTVPLGAIVLVGAIAAGAGAAIADDAPVVSVSIDNSALRDPTYGFLCEGRIPIQLSISRGNPPYEVLMTMSRTGGLREGWVTEVTTAPLDTRLRIVFKQTFPNGSIGPLNLPRLDVVSDGPGSLTMSVIAIAKGRSGPDFRNAALGQLLPQGLVDQLPTSLDPFPQLGVSTFTEVVVNDCSQGAPGRFH